MTEKSRALDSAWLTHLRVVDPRGAGGWNLLCMHLTTLLIVKKAQYGLLSGFRPPATLLLTVKLPLKHLNLVGLPQK